MLGIEERTRVLHDLATHAVPETVDLWPALNARSLRERRHRDTAPIWRWAGLVTAAGVLVALPQLTIWVDKASFVPLRIEVRDGRGVVVDRSEVTSVEYNISIPAATFAYVPPAGVAVASFTGGDGAHVKPALAADPQPRTPPVKSP